MRGVVARLDALAVSAAGTVGCLFVGRLFDVSLLCRGGSIDGANCSWAALPGESMLHGALLWPA
jgi:hypothetical protein